MKQITLIRDIYTEKEVLGTLNYQFGSVAFSCKTLERPWLDNKPSISCIPKGTYTVKWTFSPKFARSTYQVMDVPGRSGIRIHKGNYFFDVEGCILLGSGYSDLNKDGQKDVIESTITIKSFETLMNKEDFTLIIT